MISPVLQQELLLGSRRNKLHILRWVYASWLVVLVLCFYLAFWVEEQGRSALGQTVVNEASAPEVVGMRFCQFFVVQQVILLLLITPPFVAGAVTDEKRRGTLQHLLLTDLEARHIILGKLLGRVALVGLIFLAGMPLFGLLAGFAGIDPLAVAVIAASLVVPLVGVASATILASVWCKQTRDAVIALYVLGLVGAVLVQLVGGPLRCLNPLYVVEAIWGAPLHRDLAEVGQRLLTSGLSWGAIIVPSLSLAILRLRPTYAREQEGEALRKVRWYTAERNAVGEEPVLWRERHVEGLAPNPSLRRIPTWLGITLIALGTACSSVAILLASFPAKVGPADVMQALARLDLVKAQALLPDASAGFIVQGVLVMLLASLVVGIRCSGAVSGERERQTWEALLLTPLSAKEIIRGKLWGVLGASTWYLLAYAVPALILSALGGFLALFYTALGLGVTFLAMYFIGATGIYCSVTSRGSWRALLSTLGIGYLGGLLLYLVTSPILVVLVFLVVVIVLAIVDQFANTNMARMAVGTGPGFFRVAVMASQVTLAVMAYFMARLFLYRSLRWVADRERTRHWYDEPQYAPRPRSRNRPLTGRV